MINSKRIIAFFILLAIIFFPISTFAADDGTYIWSHQSIQANAEPIAETKTQENSLNLESGAAILIDQKTGQVLYEHNCHEQLRPASVTKVMTILLVMEALDSGQITLDTKIPCSENAASMGGSQIWLDVREELTVDEMLKAMCVVSANDCTVAMAEYLAGTQESFVEKMNEKAKELGMNDTTFKNCHGIDEDGHVTSAYDISLMSRELLNKHPQITKYTTIWMDSLREGKSGLVNTNKLIRNYQGATGLKTGSTSLALYNLSASATRDNLSLIAVIMKAPTSKIRFAEAKKLLDYGFSNYQYKELAKKGEVVQDVPIFKGIEPNIKAIFETDLGKLIKKGNNAEISSNIQINENISAPIEKGSVIGNVKFFDGQNQIGEVNLISDRNVKKIGLWNVVTNLYSKWFNLLR